MVEETPFPTILCRVVLSSFAPICYNRAMRKAIFIAAGRGRRLMPLTEDVPKCYAAIGGRRILEQALQRQGIAVGRALEIGSREAVREAVAAGLGVGAVFESELGHDERLRKLRVTDVALTGTEYVVCLDERRGRSIESAFIQLILSPS